MSTALALASSGGLAVQPGSPEFEQTASNMAREYAQATAEMLRLMQAIEAQTARLRTAFNEDGYTFDVRFSYHNDHYITGESAHRMFADMKREAWRTLVDHLGIKNIMSVAKRKSFDAQLEKGELPDISEDTITGVLMGLAGQAQDFAKEAAKEVFDILRPRGGWGGQYKTNDAFRVGRRVILPHRVQSASGSGKFRANYNRQQELTAIDGVFHLLDGKGVMREHQGPLVKAIEESPDGRGETAYFKFKCFKNCNLHLEMKRLDLVKELNGLAAGEYVLGDDMCA